MKKNRLLLVAFFFILSTYSFAGQIDLPKTGQTECYDGLGNVIACAGTGQDGELQAGVEWPDPRFTVNGDCVIDNLTGLMWAKNANLPNKALKWQEGLDFIKSFNATGGLCGYSDWRLPNAIELGSLAHLGVESLKGWLMDQGFINVLREYYLWISSSYDSNGVMYARTVEFESGSSVYRVEKKVDPAWIWPVRGDSKGIAPLWRTGQEACYDENGNLIDCTDTGQDGEIQAGLEWPDPRFSDNGDGTATDNLTRLIWLKDIIDLNTKQMIGPAACHPETSKTWEEALGYVKCLNTNNYLGYNDWKVPNKVELQSLIDYKRENPSLPWGHPFRYPSCGFSPDIGGAKYWTSTTIASQPDRAFIIGMSHGVVTNGALNNATKQFRMPVWPLRKKRTDVAMTIEGLPGIPLLLIYE